MKTKEKKLLSSDSKDIVEVNKTTQKKMSKRMRGILFAGEIVILVLLVILLILQNSPQKIQKLQEISQELTQETAMLQAEELSESETITFSPK